MSTTGVDLAASDCHFARCVIVELVRLGAPIRRMLHAGFGDREGVSPIPVDGARGSSALARLCREAGLDVSFTGRQLDAQALASPGPADALVSVCFPRRIDPALLARLRVEGWNLHPSLLPAYRGLDPVRRQLRSRERTVGVTLHRLETVLDAGAIVSSRAVRPGPHATVEAVEAQLARSGAELIVGAIEDLGRGCLTYIEQKAGNIETSH